MKKQHDIIMLSTIKGSYITRNIKENKLVPPQDFPYNHGNGFENQHLYILSNDEIKEGDWFIRNNMRWKNVKYLQLNPDDKKIIVSTDKKITPDYIINEEFINVYVYLYNKNKHIKTVELEYETVHGGEIIDESYPDGWLLPKKREDGSVMAYISQLNDDIEFKSYLDEQLKIFFNKHNGVLDSVDMELVTNFVQQVKENL